MNAVKALCYNATQTVPEENGNTCHCKQNVGNITGFKNKKHNSPDNKK
jgi:hypothetical protein